MSGYLSMYQLTRAGTRSKQRTPPELDLWLPSYMHIVVVDFAWLVDRDDAPQLLNNCLCSLPEQKKNSLQENKAFYTWDVALPGSFSTTVVRGEVESGSQTSVSCQISVAAHRGARFQVQSFRPYIGPCRVGVEINSGRPVVCSDRGVPNLAKSECLRLRRTRHTHLCVPTRGKLQKSTPEDFLPAKKRTTPLTYPAYDGLFLLRLA